MDVSVIIVSWNTRELTLGCVESVYRGAGDLEVEVVVVDNASSDGSAQAVGALFPQARLIQNGENTGFARACNQGLAAAAGRVVVLLNSDCLVHAGALERLDRFVEQHRDYGLMSSLLVDSEGRDTRNYKRQFPWPEWRRIYHRCPDCIECAWLQGACMAARREVINEIGTLDEGFFMFCEDSDWCKRARDAGYRICCVTDSVITHLGAGSSQKAGSVETWRRKGEALARYVKKYSGHRWKWLRLRLKLRAWLLARWFAWAPGIRAGKRECKRAYYDEISRRVGSM
jgi:N-acetylglucosaminyl-diphospho-decaprenol L-rhamnosyltransferase